MSDYFPKTTGWNSLTGNSLTGKEFNILPTAIYAIGKATGTGIEGYENDDIGAFDFSPGTGETSPEVISLTLIDADTGENISVLNSTNTVNLLQHPNISIRADTNPSDVGSVVFRVNGSYFRNENNAPYAIAGDSSGNYNAWDVNAGRYVVEAVPFESANGNGEQGTALYVELNLVESSELTNSFYAVEDAYLQDGNLFNSETLKVQNTASRIRESYLKFSVSGIDGKNIDSAELKITCAADPGSGTIIVYEGSHNDWDESNLGLSTPVQGDFVDSLTSDYISGREYSFDVSSLISGDGDYTFILVQEPGGNDVSFYSSEGINVPELVIVSSAP
jgi:hypothetical protein